MRIVLLLLSVICRSTANECNFDDHVPGLAECEEWDFYIFNMSFLLSKRYLINCPTEAILFGYLL